MAIRGRHRNALGGHGPGKAVFSYPELGRIYAEAHKPVRALGLRHLPSQSHRLALGNGLGDLRRYPTPLGEHRIELSQLHPPDGGRQVVAVEIESGAHVGGRIRIKGLAPIGKALGLPAEFFRRG